ncbi:protein PYRICULARIA ORYZAE RESISTANCE 21-like [Mangifera indica]|uniref:protein PYRICULARIA ORYZAE RESISTANCE 21-like n=1 Tax=Mangifera indica TaxID=29780 RepID=UPI001CFC0082|nr:protein PYRICULARIA ORYZAE RESISTANCE 21-like [Mangifera indica]
MAEPTTMELKVVDLKCCKCRKKVKKLLCKFPEIRDQVYDEKQNTVTIKVVSCCPERLMQKIRCKGCKAIKSIEIKPPPDKSKKDEPTKTKKDEPGKDKPKDTPPEKQCKPCCKPPCSPPKQCKPCCKPPCSPPCKPPCSPTKHCKPPCSPPKHCEPPPPPPRCYSPCCPSYPKPCYPPCYLICPTPYYPPRYPNYCSYCCGPCHCGNRSICSVM